MFNLNVGKSAALILTLLLSFGVSDVVDAKNKKETALACTNFNQHTTAQCKRNLITHTTKKASNPKRLRPSVGSGVIAEASRYSGLSEQTNTHTLQQLMGVNPRKTKWCAAFINAVLNNRGYRTSGGLTAASFRTYGVGVITPQKGDIIVLRSHVGFFVEYKVINGRKHVGVLGGNQSNRVQISYYPVGRIIAIRRPVG